MMETTIEQEAFPLPSPSWLVAFTVVTAYVLLLFGFDSVLPLSVLSPAFAPLGAIGGVLVYGLFLWLMDLRDPRLWRDPVLFENYVRTWADAAGQPMPDAARIQCLRRQARQAGGIVIAQQGGLVAGAGAGIAVLDYSGSLAVLTFGVTMLVVGLTLRRWMVGSA